MRHNGSGSWFVVLVGAALAAAGLAACSDRPTPEPVDVTQDAPRPTATAEDVALDEVCRAVDPAVVERLLPGAELDQSWTTGESYASVECTWSEGPPDEPAGTLTAVVDASVVPEDADPRDLLGDRCAEAEVSEDGPGVLSCTDAAGLVSVEGDVLVEMDYARSDGSDASADQRADLEQVATLLLAAMPTP